MAKTQRMVRFPAPALKALLEARPFPRAAWEAVTSEKLHVRIGNAPTATTQADALDALSAFLARTDAFACGFCEVWAVNEAIYLETELEYGTACGARQRIPCAVVARTTHALLQDLRFHLDPTPLKLDEG